MQNTKVGTIVSPCIEAPHQNRNPLKQKASLSVINWNSSSKISQELASWCVENSQGLNGNGLKDITGAKINIFVLCEWLPTLLLNLPGEMLCRRMNQPMGKWPWRPNITTCRSAKGPKRPHLDVFRSTGIIRRALYIFVLPIFGE